MAAIADIVAKARGTAGTWRVDRSTVQGREVATLYHYSTAMLEWPVNDPKAAAVISTGWGSVSDQNGMHVARSILGLPWSYSRKGGTARIVPDDAAAVAGYSRPVRVRYGDPFHGFRSYYRWLDYTYDPA